MGAILQWLRSIQPAYRAHLVGSFFVALFVCTAFVLPDFKNTHYWLLFFAWLAFAVGFLIWSWPVAKRTWGHPIGRLVIVALHLFVLLFAATLARNVVASALKLPPQDFDISVSLITLVFYIPAWLLVVSLLVGIFAFGLYAFCFLTGFFRHPFGETAKLLAHALGAFAICSYSYAAFDFVSKNGQSLHSLVKWVALYGDFQNVSAYPGISPIERVRLHENGIVSIATVENNTVIIRVRKYEQ